MISTVYSWCFDCGTLHATRINRPRTCTGHQANLGYTPEEALAAKHRTFGDANQWHELPSHHQQRITANG
ncbi:hypothetical protein AB0O39_10800 [Streptomyces anulatus]|uniref:hypothetical protein n=1 Tax=Streptomyces anulatus TaxID=1892 RepID=UPI003420994E